jgi:hypothetical protein
LSSIPSGNWRGGLTPPDNVGQETKKTKRMSRY